MLRESETVWTHQHSRVAWAQQLLRATEGVEFDFCVAERTKLDSATLGDDERLVTWILVAKEGAAVHFEPHVRHGLVRQLQRKRVKAKRGSLGRAFDVALFQKLLKGSRAWSAPVLESEFPETLLVWPIFKGNLGLRLLLLLLLPLLLLRLLRLLRLPRLLRLLHLHRLRPTPRPRG